MLSKKKRIAAVLMTVVIIIATVNFCPAEAAEPEPAYSTGVQAEETDTATEEAEGTAVTESEEQEPKPDEEIPETSGTEAMTEAEATTEEAAGQETTTETSAEEPSQETEASTEEYSEGTEEAHDTQNLQEEELQVSVERAVTGAEPAALTAAATASVTGRQDVSHGLSYGHGYTVNDGATGYSAYCCAKDNSNTPSIGGIGTVTDITEWGNGPAYRRIFYFGCLPAYSFDSEAHRILAVSQTLSAYYSGTSNTFAAFDDATKGFTVPAESISVTAPTTQVVKEGNIQKTGTYTISADGHTSVSVTIPDGVTLY